MYSLSSFKSYDIRGVWQTEIDEKFGRIMGYALGLHLIEKFGTPNILITSDVREANNVLIDEFLIGMKSAGIEKVTVAGKNPDYPQYRYGVFSSPMAYYAAIDSYDCACLITASHNPSEYVGMKIVDNKCLSIKSSELKEIFQKQEQTDIADNGFPEIVDYAGTRIRELLEDVSKKFQTLKKIPKITIDYSHGAATHVEQQFLKEMLGDQEMRKNKYGEEQTFESKGAYGDVSDGDEKVKGQSQTKFFRFPAVHIFTNPDGTFPAHDTDTSRFANYQPLIREVQKNGSDFGFIFDGDADRFGMVTPDGNIITGDILLAIVARELLTDGTAERLGSKEIFHEVCCGRIIGDIVKKYGGNVHVTQVGRESFVREVIEKNGLLAGEISTHLLFKEYGTIEMPIAGLFYILKALEKYSSATEMVKELDIYARGQIFQFKTDKKDEIIEDIKKKYAEYEQITIDGVRVEAPDFWFTVRKSNTEPILKLSIEAKDRDMFNSILADMREFFTQYGAVEKV